MAEKDTANPYGSKEYIALKLLERVADHDRSTIGSDQNKNWVLDLYAECLYAANGFRDLPKKP